MSETQALLTGPAAGFPEFTPAGQRAFNQAYATLVHVAERFGFTPLETAAVERVATLSSKGVLDKEVYGLRRLKAEDGDDSKDLGLHFDLTVPMARYVSANQQHLVFPFRRWQSQPVWRGERPQVGRYRQFYQFDLDHVGRDTLPVAADAEVLAAAFMGLQALGVGPFVLRVNDRRLLTGLLDWAGFATEEAKHSAMKVIDDLEKVAPDVAHSRLVAIMPEAKVGALLDLLRAEDGLAALAQVDLPDVGQAGLASVTAVLSLAKTLAGLGAGADGDGHSIRLDLSIVRGLDYYTGTVAETTLLDAPELGSICSGGRYENLTAALGGSQLPGVGMSFGLSRLMVHLLGLPKFANLAATPALVGVTCQNEAALPAYAKLAQGLRAAGLNVEQCLGGAALGTQIKNLAKRGVVWAVMANADELAAGTVQVKHLPSGVQTLVPVGELAAHIVNSKH
jgi:histidyl-tRNA synthetase